MRFPGLLLCGLCLAACGSSVAPAAREAAPQSLDADPPIVSAFKGLSRASAWTQVRKISLPFSVFEPEGIVKRGDYFYMTATDRTAGRGHLFTIALDGALVHDLELTDGPRNHPGGVDDDGRYLYTAIAEPNAKSSAIVVKIDPQAQSTEKLFSFADHVSFAINAAPAGRIIGDDYDDAVFRIWSADGSELETIPNPARLVELQDCKSLSWPYAFCSGLKTVGTQVPTLIGSLQLRDLRTMKIVHEVPFQQFVDGVTVAVTNPSFLELAGDKLRLYVAPGNNTSGAIYVYETPATPDPYAYTGEDPGVPPPPRGLAAAVARVQPDTAWTQVQQVPLQFAAYHPQGLKHVGDRFYLTSVDSNGQQGYLFAFDGSGALLSSIMLKEGARYHPGGLDYDGTSLWLPLAEYVADSSASIYRVDPATLQATKVFEEVHDHVGGWVHDSQDGGFVGLGWGSRRMRYYAADGTLLKVRPNPTHMIDYQDCQAAEDGYAICAGVIDAPQPFGAPGQLGAIALVHLPSNTIVNEFAWTASNGQHHPSTQNTFAAELDGDTLRFYFASDDNAGVLYAYEAQVPAAPQPP